jgi:hypothetical protein
MSQYPLSYTQEFLCAFDKGDGEGSFSPRYHNTRGWRLSGTIDLDVLQHALNDVVARHEALRTAIVHDGGTGYQEVLPPSPPALVVHDLSDTDAGSDSAPESRDRRVEEFLNQVEAGAIDAHRHPVLRAELGRFDDNDAVLVLIAHHTATDGWSMRVIMRDLAHCYATRTGHDTPPLPTPRQYREYAVWQKEALTEDALASGRDYWRQKLHGSQMLAVPMDRPRSELTKVTSTHRFVIDTALTSATLKFAAALRSSPFMVLLTAYELVLRERTGATDIVVPTLTAGRGHPEFEDTVGTFFNFIPLRTSLDGCATLREAMQRTRTTCIEAQTYEVPFGHIVGEAPELMAPFAATDLAVGAIQVFQHPFVTDGELGAGLKYAEIRRRLLSQEVSADIPDGTLWTLDVDPSDGIFGNIKFNRNEFDESTIAGMVDAFTAALRRIVTTPDAPLQ